MLERPSRDHNRVKEIDLTIWRGESGSDNKYCEETMGAAAGDSTGQKGWLCWLRVNARMGEERRRRENTGEQVNKGEQGRRFVESLGYNYNYIQGKR